MPASTPPAPISLTRKIICYSVGLLLVAIGITLFVLGAYYSPELRHQNSVADAIAVGFVCLMAGLLVASAGIFRIEDPESAGDIQEMEDPASRAEVELLPGEAYRVWVLNFTKTCLFIALVIISWCIGRMTTDVWGWFSFGIGMIFYMLIVIGVAAYLRKGARQDKSA